MARSLEIVGRLHKKTKRNYLERMLDEKVHCSEVASRYGQEYWDGDRRYGYGGYRYDGRWAAVAEALIDEYGLTGDSTILDVGCGKAYLLYELQELLPGCEIAGFDISDYALSNAKPEIRDRLFRFDAGRPFPFDDGVRFDLILSLMTLHNLRIDRLFSALAEIERFSKNAFITVESYRNRQELFNLQCWALTCRSFFGSDEWPWILERAGYSGDYELLYFE